MDDVPNNFLDRAGPGRAGLVSAHNAKPNAKRDSAFLKQSLEDQLAKTIQLVERTTTGNIQKYHVVGAEVCKSVATECNTIELDNILFWFREQPLELLGQLCRCRTWFWSLAFCYQLRQVYVCAHWSTRMYYGAGQAIPATGSLLRKFHGSNSLTFLGPNADVVSCSLTVLPLCQ